MGFGGCVCVCRDLSNTRFLVLNAHWVSGFWEWEVGCPFLQMAPQNASLGCLLTSMGRKHTGAEEIKPAKLKVSS